MNNKCSQCGLINPNGTTVCCRCDYNLSVKSPKVLSPLPIDDQPRQISVTKILYVAILCCCVFLVEYGIQQYQQSQLEEKLEMQKFEIDPATQQKIKSLNIDVPLQEHTFKEQQYQQMRQLYNGPQPYNYNNPQQPFIR